jgi:two-component system phosphate regulon sensor histidine kinase PhoR
MRVKQIRHTIILGVIALIGIVSIQGYWLFTTWQTQQEKLDENIWLALKNTSTEINVLHDCLPNDLNPVQQLTETCYLVDVSCEYNQSNLEHLIHTNFNKLNINIEHQVAIFNCNSNQLEYMGTYSGSGENIFDQGNIDFCSPDNANGLAYYFIINISGRNVYLIQKMQLWFVLSLIVLVIVLFFTYTIFAFFKQKLLAELQKDFINNMTHEFKTPISSINIASDVLLSYSETEIPERFLRYAQLIKQENSRLNKQVENILRAARFEKAGTIMHAEPLNLHEILNNVFTPELFMGAKENLWIEKQLHASHAIILADKLHLTNLLFNLADNATKYNQSETKKLSIETQNTGKYLALLLRDNGIGIQPKYKKKIFTKFFRVPTGNVHDVKGFGLGLFYVKQVCDAHKWKITFESEPLKGTQFQILIPIIHDKGNQ